MKRREFAYDVFLSYTSMNEPYAQQIKAKLENAGISCYHSADYINSGEEFSGKIRKALVDAREMCVLCSKGSIKSMWVHTEWGAAWALRKHVVPILLEIDNRDLPDRLQSRHALEFHDLDKYVAEVKERKIESQLKLFEDLFG